MLSPLFCWSQNISFSEIVNLRSKSPGQVESFLTNKGWELIGTDRDEYDFITISYSFNRSSFDNKASGFISYSYKTNKREIEYWNVNLIDYQIHDLNLYKKINSDLIKLGYKEIDYLVKDDRTEKHYKSGSGKTIAILTTSIQSGENSFQSKGTIYNISLWPPSLYEFYPRENSSQDDELANVIERLTNTIVDSIRTEENNSFEKPIRVREDVAILSEPSLRNAKVIGRIKDGKANLINKTSNGFLKIKSGGIIGYILENSMITW